MSESTVELRLYIPDEELKKSWETKKITEGVELFRGSSYDPQKPLLLILHGWNQGADDVTIIKVLDTLFEIKFYEKMNIMVLDSPYFMDSMIFNILYFSPAAKTEILGKITGDVLNKAIEENLLKSEDINMVGFSLGAHLCGYISRATSGQVNTILGLDPAGPGFDHTIQSWTNFMHVSEKDAEVVHLFHTASISFGTLRRVGTADFEFNYKGYTQPGCMKSIYPFCSHQRAFQIFIDIIQGDKNLIALNCESYSRFQNCECEGNSTVVLQYPIDNSAKGRYILKTTSKAPFGLGRNGIKCSNTHLETMLEETGDETRKIIETGADSPKTPETQDEPSETSKDGDKTSNTAKSWYKTVSKYTTRLLPGKKTNLVTEGETPKLSKTGDETSVTSETGEEASKTSDNGDDAQKSTVVGNETSKTAKAGDENSKTSNSLYEIAAKYLKQHLSRKDTNLETGGETPKTSIIGDDPKTSKIGNDPKKSGNETEEETSKISKS